MLSRFITRQLPLWGRPEHPIMRYMLGYHQTPRRQALIQTVLVLLLVAVSVGVSYAYVASTTEETPSYREFMYYPLVGAGILAQLLALTITVNWVALERQKETWETLQITTHGAEIGARARWMLVFYRLAPLLALIFVGRMGYVAALLQDITDFEGRAIDVRIIGISPEVTLEVAVFILAAFITAALIQPFVSLGLDAAIGLFIGATTKRRAAGILTTVTLMGVRAALSFVALQSGGLIISANGTTPEIIDMSAAEAWGRTLLMATQGDWSLRLLSLETLGNLWADLDEGIYLGLVILGLVVVQAVLANLLVIWAAHRIKRPARV
jgi:hypothetical protein